MKYGIGHTFGENGEPDLGTILRDKDGDIWVRMEHGWDCLDGQGEGWGELHLFEPLVVIGHLELK